MCVREVRLPLPPLPVTLWMVLDLLGAPAHLPKSLNKFKEGRGPECMCVCVPHGYCLGHRHASRVNYIDLDHSRSHLNHESHKCSIISETVQAIAFAVKT